VYSLSCYEGFIKAQQTKTIDITIIVKVVGKHSIALKYKIIIIIYCFYGNMKTKLTQL
jgi:hypothetical protein